MVNAPRFFLMAFGIVKPFLSDYVKNNIHFHSNLDALHAKVSKEVLPEELGGTCGKFDNSKAVEHATTMEKSFDDLKSCMYADGKSQ